MGVREIALQVVIVLVVIFGAVMWARADVAGVVGYASHGDTLEGVAYPVGTVLDRRCWLDVFEPQGDPWVGASFDIRPRSPECVGAGYDWSATTLKVYVGIHF